MMRFLIRDVISHPIYFRKSDGKRTIAPLPREILDADGFVNPSGRGLFDVLNKCSERVRSLQANQQVNMVSRATDGFGNRVCRPHQSAEIFVKAGPPCGVHERVPVFRAEHEVKMETQVRGGHDEAGRDATLEISQPRSGWKRIRKPPPVPEGRWNRLRYT